MRARERELLQKAEEEFTRRAAEARNDEERVQLLTVAQAYKELAEEHTFRSENPPPSEPA
jgi:hypothetical protein